MLFKPRKVKPTKVTLNQWAFAAYSDPTDWTSLGMKLGFYSNLCIDDYLLMSSNGCNTTSNSTTSNVSTSGIG